MKKLTILFFFFQFSIAYTQNSQQKIDSLLDLSRKGMFKLNLNSTFKNGKKALDLSEKENYSMGKARAHYYIANALFEIGDYKQSLKHLSSSIDEKYTLQNPQLIADIYRVRGRIYGNMELHQTSVEEFKKGIEAAKKIEIPENSKYTQSLFYENLAFLYKKRNQLDSVKFYLDKNAQILESLNEEFVFRNKINYFSALGDYYLKLESYNLSKNNFQKALDIAEKYNYPYTSDIHKNWGNLYIHIQDTDSALIHYFNALESIQKTGLKTEIPEIYQNIADAYKLKGDSKNASEYYIKANNTRKELIYQKQQANESVLNILVDEKSEEVRQNNYVFFVITLIVVVGTGLLFLFFYLKKQHLVKRRLSAKRNLIAEKEKIIQQKEEETKKLKLKLNESFEEVIQLAKDNHPEFILRFEEVYPDFHQKISCIEPKLLKSEIKFCALLYLNFSTKDIAEYTFVTVKAVQHSRFRLRKKLTIPSDADIIEWINENY